MARLLGARLQAIGLPGSFLIDEKTALARRGAVANAGGADFLISIHHDSVQPLYLSAWTYEGKPHRYSDRFSGFSLFVARGRPNSARSLALAQAIGSQLLKEGLRPTLHHAEKIKGESRELIDRERGIYAFDDLIILKTAGMPAVLLECGVLVNREEEVRLGDPVYQARLVSAIAAGIRDRCGARGPQG